MRNSLLTLLRIWLALQIARMRFEFWIWRNAKREADVVGDCLSAYELSKFQQGCARAQLVDHLRFVLYHARYGHKRVERVLGVWQIAKTKCS